MTTKRKTPFFSVAIHGGSKQKLDEICDKTHIPKSILLDLMIDQKYNELFNNDERKN